MRLGDRGQPGTLVDLVNQLTDNQFGLSDCLAFFNACSKDLTPVARLAKRATAEYEKDMNGEVAVPPDLYSVQRLTLQLDGMPFPRELEPTNLAMHKPWTYRKWGRTLLILPKDRDGKLVIYYYARLPEFDEDPDAEPSIPSEFHDLYALYAAWKLAGAGDTYVSASEGQTLRSFQEDYLARRREFDDYTYFNQNLDPVRVQNTLPEWWG